MRALRVGVVGALSLSVVALSTLPAAGQTSQLNVPLDHQRAVTEGGVPRSVTALGQGSAPAKGRNVTVFVRGTTPATVPGGAASFLVTASNSGTQATASPTTLTINVPPGMTFSSMTNLTGSGLAGLPTGTSGSAVPTWNCPGAGVGASSEVRCTLTAGATSAPGTIAPESVVPSILELRVSRGIATNRQGVTRTLQVSLSTPSNSATSATSAKADVLVVPGTGSATLFPNFSGSPSLGVGQPATETVELLNLGSGAVTGSLNAPVARLSNLLPPGLVGSWQAAGTDWVCTGPQVSSPSCSYTAGTLQAGAATPPLTLTYQADAKRVAKLRLQPGGQPKIVRWTVGIESRRSATSPSQSYQNQIAVQPPQPATLQIQAAVANGADELVPGSQPIIDVNIVNSGPAATAGDLVVAGSLPRGIVMSSSPGPGGGSAAAAGSQIPWTCVTRLPSFACTPVGEASIPASGSTLLTLHVSSTAQAPLGDGMVALQARAANQAPKLGPATAIVHLVVLPSNAGFPALKLLTSTGRSSLVPVTNGAAAALRTGDRLRERLDITDAGGAPILPGRVATLTQRFSPGVAIRVARVPSAGRCATSAGPSPTLSCSIPFVRPLAPGAVREGPTVVLVPSIPTAKVRNWAASIRLTGRGAPPALPLAVQVTVAAKAPRLATTTGIRRLPTAGGFGRWSVTVSNQGDLATSSPVSLRITLPSGTTNLQASAKGWVCSSIPSASQRSVSALCVHTASLRPGKTLRTVVVGAHVPRETGGQPWRLTASASIGDQAPTKGAKATLSVIVHRGIRAVIVTPRRIVFDNEPLIGSSQPITQTEVPLEADGSGGNGLALTYTWRQRCLTPADVAMLGGRCPNQGIRVKWLNQPPGTVNPNVPNVAFKAPDVSAVTKLVFQLTVKDGSATASTFSTVTVLPTTPASQGFAITDPRPPASTPQGPMGETVKLPKPAIAVDRTGRRGSAGRPARQAGLHPTSARLLADPSASTTTPSSTTAPSTTASAPSATTTTAPPSTTTTAPPTTSTSAPPVTTTTAPPTTTTTLPPTTTPPNGVSAVFCDLVRDAVASKEFTIDRAGISLTIRGVRVAGSGCATSTKVEFSDSKFALGSVLTGTGLAGSIGADGIHFTAGTLTGPSDWNSPSYSLADGSGTAKAGSETSNVTVTYTSADGLALEGSVSASGFLFIPLGSGWTSSTKLDFAAGAGGTSLKVSAQATGPLRDTSPPDSPKPSVTIDGSVALDGTFSLAASAKNLVQLRGAVIDLSGSIARTTPGAPIALTITGSLAAPVEIVKGLSLTSLAVTMSPTANSLGLTGSGAVSITTGSQPFGVAVDLSYQDPRNWSLTATGTGTSTWTPMSGLTISPSDISGSIKAENDAYRFSLVFKPAAPWTPKAGVSVSNMSLALSNTCQDSGSPCPKNASLFLTVGGDVTFTLPVVGTVSTTLAGSLGLPNGNFGLVAKLTQPLDLGAGIRIEEAQIQLTRGESEPAGVGVPAASEGSSGLSVLVHGQVSLPLIGTLPAVDASWSTSGWALAANLGSYSLPGAGGNGTKLTDTIVGWSSFPTSLNILDPVTKAIASIPLKANTFEVSGAYTTPDWFKKAFDLSSDVEGRATGSINLSNGDFALRMSITPAPDWYLYGDAATETSIRLASVYFEIERQGANFSIALGGEAAMVAPGVTAEDPLALTVAVSYSTSTTTLAGTFTLASKSGWQDAFGAEGLTLYGMALAFQLNIATLTPSVGLAASAILPPKIQKPLGMTGRVRTTVVANISLTNPCLGIDVEDSTNSGRDVINIGSGALTAKEFTLEIAPFGCTVGQFRYEPGFTLYFNGAILGTTVEILGALKISPFSLDAKIDVGDFTVAGVQIDRTTIFVTAGSSKVTFGLSGGIHFLGTSLTVSGKFSQKGLESNFEFSGKLTNLVIGSFLTVKNVTVDARIRTGLKEKVNASFSASGDIDLLGSTVLANMRLKIANAELAEVFAAIRADITVGGSDGVNLNGTFDLEYGPSIPLLIDGNVALRVGGFNVAAASVFITPAGARLSAEFSIGGVFSAMLDGAFYSKAPRAGTTILGPNNRKVVAQSGDFLLSARDVTIDLAGFRSTGSVSFGRAGGLAWGAFGARIQLLGSATDNAIDIGGSFSGNGDFSLSGHGVLDLIGIRAEMSATVAKVGTNVSVRGSAGVNILSSSATIGGEFSYNGGSPRFRLNGAINLNLGGYRFASATVFFSNFPQDAGVQVAVNSQIGSVLTLAGRLTVEKTGGFYLGLNTALNLVLVRPAADVTFTNCRYTYTTRYHTISFYFFTFSIPYYTDPVCNVGATKLDAKATVSSGGFSFAISTNIDSNGNFRASASSPESGKYSGQTGTLWLAVVAFYVAFSYHMSLTVSSGYPYVSVSGSGSADIYGKTWDIGWLYAGWGGWRHILGAGASISTNPFSVCGSARVWGFWVGPLCV